MAAPAIPTNFFIQQANGQVLLSWDLVAGASAGYPIKRSTDGVTFSVLATATTNNYLDTTALVGTLYYYQVAASNGTVSPYTSPQQIIPTLQGQMSLLGIRQLAQQRADRVNSQFVKTSEWNTYINQSYFELYDLLVTLFEDIYMASPIIFQTTGTTPVYPLPDGVLTFTNADTGATGFVAPPFYKLLGVDCGLATTSNAWVTLKKFDYIARNRYIFPNISSTFLGVFNLQYRVMGNNIRFIPTPSGAQYIKLSYIPKLTELLKDTDMVDGVSGWTEYIVVDAAIKALMKEESDVSALMAQKQALIQRINTSAMNRDAGAPDTISNSRTWSERWGGYGGPGFDGGFGGY